MFSNDIIALNEQIEEKLMAITEKNNIQEIKEYKTDICNYITKKAKIAGELSPSGSYIKNLIEQKNQLEKNLLEGSKTIISPTSGIVSYRIDNLEKTLTPTNFENITTEFLEKLNLKTGKVITSSDENAKIVNNFKCYIAVSTNTKEAKQAEEGDKIKIRLSTGEEIDVKIEHINEEKNKRVLIFSLIQQVEKLVSYRKISVDIIWWEATGLKVPTESIIYENGLSYITKKENDKQKKVLVKVIKENETYCVVNNYKTEELIELGFQEEEINKMPKINIYDEVITKPKT